MTSITPDTLSFIIEKAREYDAESAPVDADSGSNPADDAQRDILEDTSDNPTRQELAGALDALNEVQRLELLAMMLIGRGDYDASAWVAALRQARDIADDRLTDYLIETPLFGDYLASAANDLGIVVTEYPGTGD
jgi:hypothetical protein